jgi:RimJ/RimL family protein N-acetyltransferase
VQRMLRAVFAHPLVTTVVGETLEDLTASIRVMESCGFHRVSTGGTGYSGEENVIRYDLPRAVWESQAP